MGSIIASIRDPIEPTIGQPIQRRIKQVFIANYNVLLRVNFIKCERIGKCVPLDSIAQF